MEGVDSIFKLRFLKDVFCLLPTPVTCKRHELVTSPYLLTARNIIDPLSSVRSRLMINPRPLLLSSNRSSSAMEIFSPAMYHSISIGGYPVSKHNNCNSLPNFFWTLNGRGVTICGCNSSSAVSYTHLTLPTILLV